MSVSRWLRPLVTLIGGAAVLVLAGASASSDEQAHRVRQPSRWPPPVILGHTRLAAGAVSLAVWSRGVWVSGFGAMTRLDPTSGAVVATVKTPGTGDYSDTAIGDRSVWITATGEGFVYRIDPARDRVVARIDVGGSVIGVAVGARHVWVTRARQGPGEVIEIDPRTNRASGSPIVVGSGPAQVVYGRRALWVENTSPASLTRIDVGSERLSEVTAPLRWPGGIAVIDGSLWVASDGAVSRLDLRTGSTLTELSIPRASLIAGGGGAVWVVSDPRSSSQTVSDPIPGTAALWEISPTDNRVVAGPLRLDALEPIALAASDRNIWVADYASQEVTRIGAGR